MLVYDLLGIDFWSFVRFMAVPNLAALAVNLAIFLILFRSEIPARFDEPVYAGPGTGRWFLASVFGPDLALGARRESDHTT